jgi:hypothetical protein
MAIFKRAEPHLKLMQSNFKLMLGRFDYRILFFPPAVTILLWIIMANGVVKPTKPPLEIAAVVVSGRGGERIVYVDSRRSVCFHPPHFFSLEYGPLFADYVP